MDELWRKRSGGREVRREVFRTGGSVRGSWYVPVRGHTP